MGGGVDVRGDEPRDPAASLRILHAVRSDRFAGVEQFVLRLALAQAEAGHTVTVIGGAADRMHHALERVGVASLPASRTGEVIAGIRHHAPSIDVVNTHMTAADGAAVVALAGRHRPAVVSTRHFVRRRGRFRMLPLDPFVHGTVDAELSISRAVAEAIGVASTVVYTGVEDRPVASGQRERTVLVAQRLQPEKHTHIAVEAFAASGLAAEGWMLQIAGEGPEAERLTDLARARGIGGAIRLLGFRPDVADLMQRAELLIAPCPTEGLGLTVLEAMASGLAVTAADAGGHREILEGLDGLARFVPDDVESAAARLRALANDDAARLALGAAGRERQRAHFSIASQLAGTDAVYREAIARHGAGRSSR